MKKGKNKRKNKGFSLVEILVAIALLGVLMTLAANAYNTYKKKARQQAYDTMAKSATNAATNYLMDNASSKFITFETLIEKEYLDTLQDPKYKEEQCSGIVINKVIQGEEEKKLDILFQKVKLCCKDYKYQYDYTGEEVKVTEIDSCEYVEGDEIDGVYKLIYKPSGGTECVPSVVMKRQKEKWGDLCVTKRENFAFKGWNTKKSGKGTTITKDTVVGDRDISVYAIWNEIFALNFEEEGGTTCAKDPIKKENGEEWGTLCTTTKENYEFKGWRTKRNGSGKKIIETSIAEENLTVYAHWNPYITIMFDSQGGSTCDPSFIKIEKDDEWGTLCTPTRSGYVFKGWNTKADGTGTTITATTKADFNEDDESKYTIYAIWNPLYTLTYNENGGKACDPKSKIEEKGKEWGTLCTPEREEHVFNGWFNGTTKITKTSIVKDNIEVIADWTINKYTLIYNDNGGSGCSGESITDAYGSTWGTLCNKSELAGHTFKGWNTKKDGTGTTITSSSKITKDIKVYAQWQINSYKLTYDDNGGSGCSGESITDTYGSTWGTLCNKSELAGHTFKSWNTKADGSGTTITSSSKITKNIKVYAQWQINSYKLTYDDNGGSGCSGEFINKKYGSTWGTLCNKSELAGHTFKSWNTKADGSGTTITSSSKAMQNTKVYAQWQINSYKLTYDDNGGSGCSGEFINQTYGSTWGTLCNKSELAGHTFKSWNTKADGTGTTITSSSKVTKNIKVYAKWEANSYKLTYDDNGGSGCSGESITKSYGSTWGTLCNKSELAGYTFKGWNTKADGTGTTITSSSKVTQNIKVYAKWETNSYKLTYDDNGGSGCSGESITESYGSTWGTLCNKSELAGHTFKGWNTKADGTGTTITSSSKITKDIKVYAKWEANSYTLTYDDNGGSGCSGEFITKSYGSTWGALCNKKARTGYTFKSWNTKADGTGSTITSSSKITQDIKVYAQWQANSYKLTYNTNGGSQCSEKTGYYESAWGELCTTEREGYKFGGWYDGNTNVTTSTVCYGNRNVTAKWTANSTEKTVSGSVNGGSSTLKITLSPLNPDKNRGIISAITSNGNTPSCSYSDSSIVCTITGVTGRTVSTYDDCQKLANINNVDTGTVSYLTNEYYDYYKWASDATNGCYIKVAHGQGTKSTWTCMLSKTVNSFLVGSESHCRVQECGYTDCLTRGYEILDNGNKTCQCWRKLNVTNYSTIYETTVTVKYYSYN